MIFMYRYVGSVSEGRLVQAIVRNEFREGKLRYTHDIVLIAELCNDIVLKKYDVIKNWQLMDWLLMI